MRTTIDSKVNEINNSNMSASDRIAKKIEILGEIVHVYRSAWALTSEDTRAILKKAMDEKSLAIIEEEEKNLSPLFWK
jgi:hypothetical protein